MDEWDSDYDDEHSIRPRAEGVRIIGAEEAAQAVANQSGENEVVREPLRFDRGRVADEPTSQFSSFDDGASAAPPNLPHWTEPATGEVPAVLTGRFGETDVDFTADADDDDDLAAWSALSGGAPRWRDQHDDWDDAGFDDASVLAGTDRPMGALDESRASLFEFDEDHSDVDGFPSFNLGGDAPAVTDDFEPEVEPIPLRPLASAGAAPRPPRPQPAQRPQRAAASAPTSAAQQRRTAALNAQPRDMQAAVTFGGGLAVIALVLFKLGPAWTMLLATAVVVVAAAELYDVLRRAGYQPATLVGLAGTLGLMVTAYQKGETALPLVTLLVVVGSMLWYLIKVVHARPTVNIAATVMAFLWTGVMGSYAALILGIDKHGHTGVAFLLGAVIATVASDVGAFFIGSRMGSKPLAPEISPNKTVEGLVGGALAAMFASLLILKFIPGVAPWDGGKAIWLGLVVAIVAPVGDLVESMVKRDLGIKDMGNLLPGHGGVLDRFDALLFVLPATYYLLRVLY